MPIIDSHRALSCEAEPTNHIEEEGVECLETGNWSSDCSNSDDEDHPNIAIPVCIKLVHYSNLSLMFFFDSVKFLFCGILWIIALLF